MLVQYELRCGVGDGVSCALELVIASERKVHADRSSSPTHARGRLQPDRGERADEQQCRH